MWEVDEYLTPAPRLDSEPRISASGAAITDVTKAARTMSWSFMVSSFEFRRIAGQEDKYR